MKGRYLICLIGVLLLSTVSIAQSREKRGWLVWQLSEKAENGDRESLDQLIELSGKRRKARYFFGRHWFTKSLGSHAGFNLWKICTFPDSIAVYPDENILRRDACFFKSKQPYLYFDTLAHSWVSDTLLLRKVDYRFKSTSASGIDETKMFAGLQLDSIEKIRFNTLWEGKNPKLLFEIARVGMLKRRSFFSFSNCEQLIEGLIGSKLEVKNSYGRFPSTTDRYDHYDVYLVNYYVFWLQHYDQFTWNETKQQFESSIIEIAPPSDLELLVKQLSSPDEREALNAMQLLIDTADLYADELETFHGNKLFDHYWLKVARQLRSLDAYLNEGLQSTLMDREQLRMVDSLKLEISPMIRRSLEQRLLRSMDFESITALERMTLLQSGYKNLAFSTAYITNRFYSENWSILINDPKQLRLYLKKTALFHNIGIAGNCYDYCYKFDKMSKELKQQIISINTETKDKDLLYITNYLKKHSSVFELPLRKSPNQSRMANRYSADQLDSIVMYWSNPATDLSNGDVKKELQKLLDNMHGDDLILLAHHFPEEILLQQQSVWKHVLEWEHGMKMKETDSVDFSKELKRVLRSSTIKEVYCDYLNDYHIVIKKEDGTLHYQVLDTILKYDMHEAFIGSISTDPGLAYVSICLLEQEFGTSLGFAGGYFPWEMSNTANTIDQAAYWRNFLREKELVQEDSTPISFHHVEDWKGVNKLPVIWSHKEKQMHRRYARKYNRARR